MGSEKKKNTQDPCLAGRDVRLEIGMWFQTVLKPVQNQVLFLIAGEANHMLGHARRGRSSAGHPLVRDAEKLGRGQQTAVRQEGAWGM